VSSHFDLHSYHLLHPRYEELDIPANWSGKLWRHTNRRAPLVTHQHVELEMNVVCRGTATYLVKDHRCRLSSGAQLWLFPGHAHVLIEQSTDFEMWILVIRPNAVSTICKAEESALMRDSNPAGLFFRRLSPSTSASLVGVFEDIQRKQSNAECYNAGLAYALLASWDEYQRAECIANSGVIDPAVQQALNLLRENEFATGIDSLAAAVKMSPSRLSRLFRADLGISLVEFRNRQRLDLYFHLKRIDPKLTTSQAALDAGFGSYAQFYRVYRKATGHGPRAQFG